MTVMTDKISDTVASRVGAARQLVRSRVKPYTGPSGRAAAKLAADQAADRAKAQLLQARIQARALMQDTVLPTMRDRVIPTVRQRVVPAVQDRMIPAASAAYDNAMTKSEPMRKEAMRRAGLAAAALRGVDSMVVVKKSRRWPVAVGFLALGGAVGAAAAWLAQAGKPTQLAPYPLPGDEGQAMVDLDAEERSRNEQ